MTLNTYNNNYKYIIPIITNVNGLNAPTKGQRVAEWIRKQ